MAWAYGVAMLTEVDVAVIGAGPAGLTAALEAARAGASVLVLDENGKPGGQLFKQIHKFFGSHSHFAGTRGIDIGKKLLDECQHSGATMWLDTVVWGIFPDLRLGLLRAGKTQMVQAKRVIMATGANENALSFPGWTLPGVMTAGAAQTMINLHRVRPGHRVLMLGAGNIGLIVSYQLLQAGADVVAVVEAMDHIGGYAVHAAKLRRAGVPIKLRHTVKEARGNGRVEEAVLVQLDDRFREIEGSAEVVPVDTICLAVGLTPMIELALMAGCRMAYIPESGGHVPLHSADMETCVAGLYVAGDITGVEEASTAMEEGRLAGVAAASSLGLLDAAAACTLKGEIHERLNDLRSGPFGEKRRLAKERQTVEMSQ